jgi:hypothetical protein
MGSDMAADAVADLTTPRRSMGTAADASAAIETTTGWTISIEEMESRSKFIASVFVTDGRIDVE